MIHSIPFTPRYPVIAFANRLLRIVKPNETLTFKNQEFKAPPHIQEAMVKAFNLAPRTPIAEDLREHYRVVQAWARGERAIGGNESWPGFFPDKAHNYEPSDAVKEQIQDMFTNFYAAEDEITIVSVR